MEEATQKSLVNYSPEGPFRRPKESYRGEQLSLYLDGNYAQLLQIQQCAILNSFNKQDYFF